MDFIRETDEVFRSRGPVTQVTVDDIAFLKDQAARNPRRRARFCVHPDSEDRLHEMLIVHAQAAYVPPHKHPNKSESFHIIEGLLTVFLFSDEGAVAKVIPMGEIGMGRAFYYRLSASVYHTVWPESEFVVFHEVTNGPFDRRDTITAPWAPAEDDPQSQNRFVHVLLKEIRK